MALTTTITGLSETDCELKQAFDQCVSDRGTYSNRWEDYAGWTLPYLYPDENVAEGTEFQHDYQALGAQAVNNLSNRVAMTLFPPARPFFRIEFTTEQEAQLSASDVSGEEIETLTARVEREAMQNMEKVRLRTTTITALKHLIVLGNALIFFPPGKGGAESQVYNLRDWCITRDLSGNPIRIITRDRRVCSTLPDDLRLQCKLKGHEDDDKIELFTGITRKEDGRFFVKQELSDVGLVSTDFGDYAEKDLPWVPLTWNLVRGEEYGVGLVEEYAGDFSVYSELSEATLNLASIAADIKILVNPMGHADVTTLNEAESGTYVAGVADDITYLQLEKLQDFQFVQTMMDTYGRRIGAAFLLNSQVTRDAERVTAEEIRLQANELEASLGGVYSRLSEEMQQPLARLLLGTLDAELTKVEPVILTGVASLSRNNEHEQMMLFLNDLTIFNDIPEIALVEIKIQDMIRILATNRGIEHGKILKTADEKATDRTDLRENAAQDAAAVGAAQAAGQEVGSPSTIA